MKRFNCISLRTLGLTIAGCDIVCALFLLILCSYYLYNDFVEWSMWPEQQDVRILNPLSNFIAAAIDYVLLHNFSNAFYMVFAATLWIKALINLAIASTLIEGIRKKRLICITPWLINTAVSMIVEIAVFVCLEWKIDEVDTSVERRIVRSIIFGIFMVMNALFIFVIFSMHKILRAENSENNALQTSIMETSGMFQHVKV